MMEVHQSGPVDPGTSDQGMALDRMGILDWVGFQVVYSNEVKIILCGC